METTKRTITPSRLRQNIYRILDEILQTGVPVEIERKGKKLRIQPVETVDKLSHLVERPYLKVDPEEIVHLAWLQE